MAEISYPSQNIHLPPHPPSMHAVHLFSRLGAVLSLLAALLLACDILLRLHFFNPTLSNFPTIIGIVAAALAVVLYKKDVQSQLLGIISILIGSITMLTIISGNNPLLALFSAGTLKAGSLFLLIGISLIVSVFKIPHRYHFMQGIVLVALVISLFSFLENIYQYISLGTTIPMIFTTLWSSLFFLILSVSVFLMKPDRGFVGLFMTDNLSSKLARMSLLYFTTMPPLLGVLLLIGEKIHLLDAYGRLALLVVLVILVSLILTWINVRILYAAAIEHFLMKEALRVNNISLAMNATDLTSKVSELEEAKEEVAQKLNNQQTLTDLMDRS